jgi:glycogen debranching enzyme
MPEPTQDVIRPDEQYSIVADTHRLPSPQRVLKHGDSFGVFDQHGDIIAAQAAELGLYHHGTRFLSRLELRLGDKRPLLLSSTVTDDNAVLVVDLTNLDVVRDGSIVLPRGEIHVLRSRLLKDGGSIDRIRVSNYGRCAIDLPLSVHFAADFADMFEVRGTHRERRGTLHPVVAGHDTVLRYAGLDGIERRTRICWSLAPDSFGAGNVVFQLHLAPRETIALEMTVLCEEGEARGAAEPFDASLTTARRDLAARAGAGARVRASSESFNRWINRSTADLTMMATETPYGLYPYAGIPWFSTPFGRDGLITAFELLWADPEVARGVLTFLAATQATERSEAQDAEPGKILHETRRGEMAALGEVPFGRYYGSVDSTPLFVMLAHAYQRRTADQELIDRLWPHIVAALEWMARDGDADGDGFIEYSRHSQTGLAQQGWKDSHDSIFHQNGEAAAPPIALCEVQGYAYAAWRGAAAMAKTRGDAVAAAEWNAQAERIQRQFDEAFWCDELGTYAIALDGAKRPCQIQTSNPGHCLFAGIVRSRERALRTATALMSDTSFAGWGIRTVAAGQIGYNPMSYHNGSIWPHDNALAAAGLSRYGFTQDAARIMSAMFDLSTAVELQRLPELICGFHRRADERPTLYPVACAPQAWAAGAVYLLIQACLGLEVGASPPRVTFRRACLPEEIRSLQVSNLAVGHGSVDLLLERHPHDVSITVLRREGTVEVVAVK